MSSPSTVLQAPGQSVFGTVQEAIRRLEADSTTDWSQVDMAALRQHLLGPRLQQYSGVGQRHAAGASFEQRLPEFVLQLLD